MFTLAKLSSINFQNPIQPSEISANATQADALPNAIANQNRNNSSNASGEYVDDNSMTGNAKATSKLRNLIVGEELHLLGLGADFEKVMTIACKQPINASEFDSAFNAFKDKVEKKRSELGLSGKSDNSPASQVNIMIAKLKKETSPQETLSDLLQLKNSANSSTPEGRQTIAVVTPYIKGLQALNSKKATFTDKDGKTVDKNEDLKNALLNQDVSKINSILNEINEAQNSQTVKSEQTSFMSFFQNTDFDSKNKFVMDI